MLIGNLAEVLFRAEPLDVSGLIELVEAWREVDWRGISELLICTCILLEVVGLRFLVTRPFLDLRVRLVQVLALDLGLELRVEWCSLSWRLAVGRQDVFEGLSGFVIACRRPTLLNVFSFRRHLLILFISNYPVFLINYIK